MLPEYARSLLADNGFVSALRVSLHPGTDVTYSFSLIAILWSLWYKLHLPTCCKLLGRCKLLGPTTTEWLVARKPTISRLQNRLHLSALGILSSPSPHLPRELREPHLGSCPCHYSINTARSSHCQNQNHLQDNDQILTFSVQ